MLSKEKKSWKAKISNTLSTKKADIEAKCPAINHLVDDFTDVLDSTFFQNIKNQANNKDCALVYHYCLVFIFHGFN